MRTIFARNYQNFHLCLSLHWHFQKKAVHFLDFLQKICFFSFKRFHWKSHFLRRECLYVNLVFRNENEKWKVICQGRARKYEANTHKNLREWEILLVSAARPFLPAQLAIMRPLTMPMPLKPCYIRCWLKIWLQNQLCTGAHPERKLP